MSTAKIIQEAQNLHELSGRLDSLAEQHPLSSDAILRISSGIRESAIMLQVVATKRFPT